MVLTIVRDTTNNRNVHLEVDGSNQLSMKDTTAQGHLSNIKTAVEGTLAVSAASLPLPSGAASSANQSTGNASLATIAGAVSGSEMQVDVVSSALPTGAASAANQSTGNASLATLAGAVSGSEMQVDVVSSALPTGAASSALQGTANTELTAIKTALQGTITTASAGSAPSRSSANLNSASSVLANDFTSAVDANNHRSVAVYGSSNDNSLQIKVHVSDDNSNFYEAQNLAFYAGGSSGHFYYKFDTCARYFKLQYTANATVTTKYTLID